MNQSYEITTESSMDSVNKTPEFQGFADFIAPSVQTGGDFAAAPFSSFSSIGWNPESIRDGYLRLREICRQGKKVFYPLWEDEQIKVHPEFKQRFLIHFSTERKTPFFIFCAGGAYQGCASMIEAYPSCVHMNNLGYHAFVLNYRTGKDALAPNPMDDLAYAVSYIQKHADELNVEKENYVVCGFSAGGHLAACFGTESLGWKHYHLSKPGAVFLAYPVITMLDKAHPLSRDTLLGVDAVNHPDLLEKYSVEKQVTGEYPPTFIWQCSQDYEVPIENTQQMAQALENSRIPHHYETFDSNAHGWGSADKTSAEGWIERAVDFWKKQF